MAKYTLKILRCSHRKILKVCLAILRLDLLIFFLFGLKLIFSPGIPSDKNSWVMTSSNSTSQMNLFNYPANIYLFKVNNGNRKRCEICSRLTIKTPERHQCRGFGVFTNNCEHISHLFLVFLLLI